VHDVAALGLDQRERREHGGGGRCADHDQVL
jgi:hypothetical protein